MLRKSLIVMLLAIYASHVRADYLYLTDGREIFCQVIKETTEVVEVTIHNIPAQFPREMVERIERTGSLPTMEKLDRQLRIGSLEFVPGAEIKAQGLRTPAVNQVVVDVEGRVFPVKLLGIRPFPNDDDERRQVAQMLTNQHLVIVLDAEVMDASDTIQGYVYINVGPEFGNMVNETILQRGLANFDAPIFGMRYHQQLQSAFDYARNRRFGRWEQILPAHQPDSAPVSKPSIELHPSLFENVTTGEAMPRAPDAQRHYPMEQPFQGVPQQPIPDVPQPGF